MNNLEQSEYFRDLAAKAGFEDPRDFINAIYRRLLKGEAEYADNPSDARPLEEIIGEMAEEAQDVGGWGSRAHRSPELATFATPDREHIEAFLIDMALDGLALHRKAELLVEFIEDARARAPKPNREPVGCPE